MADKRVEKEIQEMTLNELREEIRRITTAFLKRDIAFWKARDQQEEHLKELDRTAKILVRRDMELLRMNDELQAMDAAKSQFVSIAAHQLRTPLSVVKWTFKMLLSGDFGPISKEQKAVIQRGYDINENMVKLVSDLLDVARIESGRFLYHFEEILIKEIVEGVARENTLNAKEKGLTLKIIKPAKIKIPPLRADKETIKMALQVLISNAINYTLPGGKIEVRYKKEKNFVEIRINDSGIGVPARQQGRLFTKFFRGDNVVRMQTQGTGLGLYIAESIIRAHKGQIGFDSEEGKGSTFWFRLPIR